MGKAKWSQGIYTPRNPEKYIGKHNPKFRSSWENKFCIFCDTNPSVLKWASEAIRIPYRNPLTGKQTIYVPDFFIQYKDKNNKEISELIEIKPKKETFLTEKTKSRDRAVIAVNHAKWASAQAYCQRLGIIFRVITEDELFRK